MSTAPVLIKTPQDIDATIRRNVKILMAARGVRATAIYRPLGISRQTWSSRLSGATRFTAAEVITIARILDVTVEDLSGSTEDLVAGQNWKKMMGPDLQILAGGGEDGTGQDGSKRERADLRLV